MRTIFNSSFYLRSNYKNKKGLSPVMIRISLNDERLTLGSAGVNVDMKKWDYDKQCLKGNSTESLQINQQLENIKSTVRNVFRRHELSDDLSLELIKSDYLGKKVQTSTIMELFKKHNEDIKSQVGITKSAATLQKYENCKRHFASFIDNKYKRSDLKLTEVTPIVINDFQIYLLSVGKCTPNTSIKIIQFFKTVIISGRKGGLLTHDPFMGVSFHKEPVDRGFLTDKEIKTRNNLNMIAIKEFFKIFINSCPYSCAIKEFIQIIRGKSNSKVCLSDKGQIFMSRIKLGRNFAIIGFLCPIFWISLITRADIEVIMFNATHSGIIIIIGVIIAITNYIYLLRLKAIDKLSRDNV